MRGATRRPSEEGDQTQAYQQRPVVTHRRPVLLPATLDALDAELEQWDDIGGLIRQIWKVLQIKQPDAAEQRRCRLEEQARQERVEQAKYQQQRKGPHRKKGETT